MAIADFLDTHDVFTMSDLLAACGDTATNRNLLYRQAKRGRYDHTYGVWWHTGRDVSVARILATKHPELVLTYHSALDALGLAHSVNVGSITCEADVPSRRVVEICGVRCEISPASHNRLTPSFAWGDTGAVVRCPSMPDLVCECLSHPKRAGGLEEVARSLGNLDRDELTAGMLLRSCAGPADLARVGMLVDALGFSHVADRYAEKMCGGPYYLTDMTRERARTGGLCTFSSRWKCYAPTLFSVWVNG